MIGVDVSRQAEEIILWATREFGFVTLDDALLDRVEHHAAEEEPRHRRARPRQGRPAHRRPRRPARHPQGAAARLQPRPAGGQGAGLRRRRHPRGAAPRVHRPGRDARPSTPTGWPSSRRRASRWPPTSPSGWSARACRSGSRTSSPARAYAAARSSASSSTSSTDEQFARDRPTADARRTRRAHRRGLGRLAQRPRRHRARPGAPSSSPSCAPRSRTTAHGWPDRPPRAARSSRSPRACSAPPSRTGASPSGSPRSRRTTAPTTPARTPINGRTDAQRGDVRTARAPLRLLHLRHALLLQRRRADRRAGRARCCCAPARSSTASRPPAADEAASTDRDLARGPGRLCQAMAIDLRRQRPRPRATSWCRVEPVDEISTGPRVGLRKAAEWPWRFWVTGDPTVSRYVAAKPR